MKNLLTETILMLTEYGKTSRDVLWVGYVDLVPNDHLFVKTSWENFEKISDFEYDDGYGGSEVMQSLIIVGDNWWLERAEYDGCEWWEFKTMPAIPEETRYLMSPFYRDYKNK